MKIFAIAILALALVSNVNAQYNSATVLFNCNHNHFQDFQDVLYDPNNPANSLAQIGMSVECAEGAAYCNIPAGAQISLNYDNYDTTMGNAYAMSPPYVCNSSDSVDANGYTQVDILFGFPPPPTLSSASACQALTNEAKQIAQGSTEATNIPAACGLLTFA